MEDLKNYALVVFQYAKAKARWLFSGLVSEDQAFRYTIDCLSGMEVCLILSLK